MLLIIIDDLRPELNCYGASRAITPRTEECTNLLVLGCLSASNVIFAAIRLEPTWMHLGEVAGLAAGMALINKTSVQAVDIEQLQNKIAAAGIPLIAGEHAE